MEYHEVRAALGYLQLKVETFRAAILWLVDIACHSSRLLDDCTIPPWVSSSSLANQYSRRRRARPDIAHERLRDAIRPNGHACRKNGREINVNPAPVEPRRSQTLILT